MWRKSSRFRRSLLQPVYNWVAASSRSGLRGGDGGGAAPNSGGAAPNSGGSPGAQTDLHEPAAGSEKAPESMKARPLPQLCLQEAFQFLSVEIFVPSDDQSERAIPNKS